MALVTNLHFLRHLFVTIDEYNQCVDDFADALYRFARKSVNDSEMAKDFVQDAFETTCKDFSYYEVFTPQTKIGVLSFGGADNTTFFAPPLI